jgi:hypothetical protein
MAQSQESTASSGYWSSAASQTAASPLNPHYLCYWDESCKGQHELNQCAYWKRELGGKLGIYYAPSGDYQLFTEDPISKRNLKHNNTGCTTVHLLVYNYEKKEVLFGLKLFKENKGNRQKCHPLLTFPSAKPYQRNGNMLEIPSRAFQWLTADTDFANQCLEQGLKNRFLFQNANVVYPVHLTNEQASKLIQNFVPNEEFLSLHWFSLAEILSQLSLRPNYKKPEETEIELAQIQRIEPNEIKPGEYQLWPVIARSLIYIRKHVPGGFKMFLKV